MSELLTLQVGAVRLAYRVWGDPDAAPMVLLHGLSSDGADWETVVPGLAATYRLYAPDLRGHGQSDWPGEYRLDQQRDDIAAFVKELGLAGATLVGHSYGGLVASLVAQRHPELVGRLVIEDSPLLLPRNPPEVPERPAGTLGWDWAVSAQYALQRNVPDPAWVAGLAAISAPTLVIAGGAASHIPQELLAGLADRIPGSRLVTIEAGHLVHKTCPEEFLAAVREFLVYDV